MLTLTECELWCGLMTIIQGWDSEVLDGHFTKQRATVDNDRSAEADQKWLKVMCNSLRQMDKLTGFVRTNRFIDIG
jgi:sialic acid synthase SpsE